MSCILANANAVVVAHHFNPSIVSQIWLVDNEIVRRDEFRSGSIFSDPIVNVDSAHFQLLVTPEQLQFTPSQSEVDQQVMIRERMGRIIETLPHTPFIAFGLNFAWHVRPEDNNVSRLSRRFFNADDRLLSREFNTDDARFGAYFSKNIFGGRLKLDVKPLSVKDGDEAFEIMQFAFNLHFDLSRENAVREILGHLERWNEVRQYVEQIVRAEEK